MLSASDFAIPEQHKGPCHAYRLHLATLLKVPNEAPPPRAHRRHLPMLDADASRFVTPTLVHLSHNGELGDVTYGAGCSVFEMLNVDVHNLSSRPVPPSHHRLLPPLLTDSNYTHKEEEGPRRTVRKLARPGATWSLWRPIPRYTYPGAAGGVQCKWLNIMEDLA
ncbi:hypothetical protein NMY22_g11813 [Coprinellus aureogranulatus]|nr:hypothetical protein NMY22_g11813 [Coprinellus aureogranulatus]